VDSYFDLIWKEYIYIYAQLEYIKGKLELIKFKFSTIALGIRFFW